MSSFYEQLSAFSRVSILEARELVELTVRRTSKAQVKPPRALPAPTRYGVKEAEKLKIAKQIIANRLQSILEYAPDFGQADDFYRELIDATLGIENFKKSLKAVRRALRLLNKLTSEYASKLRKITTIEELKNLRKEAYGRVFSTVKRIRKHIKFLREAQKAFRKIPNIDTSLKTIVVAGFANVGKSTFVNLVSTARPEIAPYPFTTKDVIIGVTEVGNKRYQIIDTPGLLDRPLSERNKMELKAIIALRHLADLIIFMVDPSETCGYPVERQHNLYREISQMFKSSKMVKVLNKLDIASEQQINKAKSLFGNDVYIVSCLRNIGVDKLLAHVFNLLESSPSTT